MTITHKKEMKYLSPKSEPIGFVFLEELIENHRSDADTEGFATNEPFQPPSCLVSTVGTLYEKKDYWRYLEIKQSAKDADNLIHSNFPTHWDTTTAKSTDLLTRPENMAPRRTFDQFLPEQPRIPGDGEVNLSVPAERERLSPSAARVFFEIMSFWEINDDDASKLLGEIRESTFILLKQDKRYTLDEDKLRRIACLLEIFVALNTLYSDKDLADKWIRMPNKNPIFGGKTPREYLLRGDLQAFKRVEDYLNSF